MTINFTIIVNFVKNKNNHHLQFLLYIAKLIGVTDAKLGNKCENVRKPELFKLFDNEIFV